MAPVEVIFFRNITEIYAPFLGLQQSGKYCAAKGEKMLFLSFLWEYCAIFHISFPALPSAYKREFSTMGTCHLPHWLMGGHGACCVSANQHADDKDLVYICTFLALQPTCQYGTSLP